jgi:hypothetical protein
MDAKAGGFGPTGKTSNTVSDLFFMQIDNLNFSAGLTHPLDQTVQHDFGFAHISDARTGIKG